MIPGKLKSSYYYIRTDCRSISSNANLTFIFPKQPLQSPGRKGDDANAINIAVADCYLSWLTLRYISLHCFCFFPYMILVQRYKVSIQKGNQPHHCLGPGATHPCTCTPPMILGIQAYYYIILSPSHADRGCGEYFYGPDLNNISCGHHELGIESITEVNFFLLLAEVPKGSNRATKTGPRIFHRNSFKSG